MPTVILDRIPLPNLKLYTTVSVALLSCCLYYAIVTTSDPDWRATVGNAAAGPYGDAAAGADAITPPALPLAATGDAAAATAQSSCDALSNASSEALAKCDDSALLPETTPPAAAAPEVTIGKPAVADVEPPAESNEADAKTVDEEQAAEGPRTFSGHMRDVVAFMCQEAVCIWVSFCCCCWMYREMFRNFD